MSEEQTEAVARAMLSRAGQWRIRVGLAAVICAVYGSMVGWPFAVGWLLGYCLLQFGEYTVRPDSRLAKRLRPATYARLVMAAVFVNNAFFGLFALAEASSPLPLAPAMAGLLIGGAIVSSALATTESRALTLAAVAPQIAILVLLPVMMIVQGRAAAEAAQVTFATLLLLFAAGVAWRRLSETIGALRAAQAQAEEASEAKSRFLATVSHEIRTPLNGVLGMAQVIANDELPDHQRERLAVVTQSGEAVLAIISEVLDLAKIEASYLELEQAPFSVEQVVGQAHATFSAIASAKNLDFRFDVDDTARGWFLGDAVRVRQILYNLVSNALKFTEAGEVAVRACASGESIRLEVSDTGPGVAPEHLPRMFEKFVQADASTTRRYGGTGLGLSISRELAKLMRGRLFAVNRTPHGLVVTAELMLPRTGAPDGALADGAAVADLARPDFRALRVLAAEDHPVNQKVLRLLLNQVGCDPHIVENGQEALQAWGQGQWDVLLLDVQMPVMDGPTAARAIRAAEAASGRARTPIIAVTANVMAHQLREYEACGVDRAVSKPLQLTELLAALSEMTSGPAVSVVGDASRVGPADPGLVQKYSA